MTGRIRGRIAFKVSRWALVRIILLAVSSALILFNSMNVDSPLIGIPASLIVLFASSSAAGALFFSNEKRFLKEILGLVVFVFIAGLLGTALILGLYYTEVLSIAVFVSIGLILGVGSLFRTPADVKSTAENVKHREVEGVDKKCFLLLALFVASTAVAFYALVMARTGEGVTSVWLTIPNFFLAAFFVSSLSMVALLFFTKLYVGLKLSMVCVNSFLSHSLFVLVWYPGRYGDVWTHLGDARYIDRTGMFYAYQWLYSQQLVTDIVKYKAQYALVVLFKRLFTVDLYWVDFFFIPVLWAIFMPVLSYKLAELMSTKENKWFPLLTAVSIGLFPSLLLWGAASVPNSLGFVFFLGTITLLIYWAESRNKRVLGLAFLGSIVTFFAHPQVGLFAVSSVLGGIVIQSRLRTAFKAILFPAIASAYLVVSYFQNATFSLEGILNLQNLIALQLDITSLVLIFGFLGLVFSIRGKLVKGKIAIMLFVFYIAMIAIYYIARYGMINAPVPGRIPPLMDILLVPFVGLGLVVVGNFLKTGLLRLKQNTGTHSMKRINMKDARAAAVLLICIFLSVQLTLALYQAYPRKEITEVQPAGYEVEAVYYIDSNSPGRYVVLSDTNFAALASGLLGIDYAYGAVARGTYGVPQWSFWTMTFSSQMARNPSLTLLESVMFLSRAGQIYFVVSVRSSDFQGTVQRVSQVLPNPKIFGNGKLYVFEYASTIIPIEGAGPYIRASFEDGSSQDVQTTFTYLVKSRVDYKVNVTGHSSYNITGYPAYWTFLDLKVNNQTDQFNSATDVNRFVYKDGLNPSDVLEVTWRGNDHYPINGWKDDSFKYDWQKHPYFATNPSAPISPNITTDGNVLSLSWNFSTYERKYQYYYYTKRVDVSTNDYPNIIVKWKSTGPVVALSVAYSSDERRGFEVVPIGSASDEWTESIVKLQTNQTVAFVTVGLSNLLSGPTYDLAGLQTVYVDYILLCGETSI